jgi:secreted trypsin-like serine protease
MSLRRSNTEHATTFIVAVFICLTSGGNAKSFGSKTNQSYIRFMPVASSTITPGPIVRPRVINGTPAPEQKTTVGLVTQYGNKAYECTGIVIGAGRVLTAGHCVCETGCSVSMTFGYHIGDPNPVKSLWVKLHPNYNHAQLFVPQAGQDLAIVAFDPTQVAPEFQGKAPIISAASLLKGNPSVMTVVGYGLTELGTHGRKMKAPVPVASLACVQDWAAALGCQRWRELLLSVAVGQTNGSSRPTDTCEGDSGGPALLIANDGSGAIAGITSRGLIVRGSVTPCGTGGIYEVPGTVPNVAWLHSLVLDLDLQ